MSYLFGEIVYLGKGKLITNLTGDEVSTMLTTHITSASNQKH